MMFSPRSSSFSQACLSPAHRPFRVRLTMAVAVVLALLAAPFGFAQPNTGQAPFPGTDVGDLCLVVQAPRLITPGVASELVVQAFSPTGEPMPAAMIVTFTPKDAVDEAGNRMMRVRHQAVAENGVYRFPLDNVPIPPGGQLDFEVQAKAGDHTATASGMISRRMRESLGYVTTDKPLYKPGETVYWRAVTLDRATLRPINGGYVHVELKDPRGSTAGQWDLVTEQGTISGSYTLAAAMPGGEYTLEITDPDGVRFPKASREFVVRHYRAPRLKMDLEFDRESYGPGESGVAFASIARAEGGVPENARARASVIVDGVPVSRDEIVIDNGKLAVPFTLPAQITDGNGTLSLAVQDGGVIENLSRTIPIVLARIDVDFFAEGGDLVAGIPGRVYFRAQDTKGELVDLEGQIVDGEGHVVAKVATDLKGLGRFEFTPQPGMPYSLRITKPVGIENMPEVPAAKAAGVVMKTAADSFATSDAIEIELRGTIAGLHTVAAYCRGANLALGSALLKGNGEAATVKLMPRADIGGVVRLTVYGPDGLPVAERLVSREPARKLNIAIEPNQSKFSPRETATVKLRATDAAGNPVVALLGVSVVDAAVLALADDEDTAPMAMHYLLGLDVAELEKVELYAGDSPAAKAAVDRLLGTQGWRRFVWRTPDTFVAENPDLAPKVLGFQPSAAFDEPVVVVSARGLEAGIFAPAKRSPVPPPSLRERLRDDEQMLRENAMPPAPNADEFNQALGMGGNVGGGGGPANEADDRNEDGADAQDFQGGDWMGDALGEPAAPADPQALGAEKPMAGRRWRQARQEMVREYAHTKSTSEVRNDFAETLYWNAAMITNAKGEAEFTFDLADSVTSYEIKIEGAAADGALGAATAEISSRIPFYIEPKMPFEVSARDEIRLPVVVVNDTEAPLAVEVMMAAEGPVRLDANSLKLQLAAGARQRAEFVAHVDQGHGQISFTITGLAGDLTDSVQRRMVVVPRGYLVQMNHSGAIERRDIFTVRIPESVEPGTMAGKIKVFPSTLSQLQSGLESLLREPNGCFEQTSSTTYPNIMVMQYLKETDTAAPDVARRAKDLIGRGYQRLVGYECPKKGFEWFGGDPGHEALTAYGIMEFIDMKQVWDGVDTGMIERTAEWLMNRRDGKGGFQRNARALDTFGRAPDHITNAYIVWALTEAGMSGQLGPELDALEKGAAESQDGYYLGLCANALANARRESAAGIVAKLKQLQKPTGQIEGTERSITGSGGQSLHIEATSLAILAFLRDRATMGNAELAVRWLCGTRQNGGAFGATQSTILALKALVNYSRDARRAEQDFDIALVVDGEKVDSRHIAKGEQGAIEFDNFLAKLTPGEHEIQIDVTGVDDLLPYTLDLNYRSAVPPTDPACAIGLKTSLTANTVAEGDILQMAVEVENRRDAGVGMVIANLGLPAGVQPRIEQLREWKDAGKIAFFETRAREVILYWRDMAPKAKVTLVLDLVGDVPGRFEGPASAGYLYYENTEKTWVPALSATVTPK